MIRGVKKRKKSHSNELHNIHSSLSSSNLFLQYCNVSIFCMLYSHLMQVVCEFIIHLTQYDTHSRTHVLLYKITVPSNSWSIKLNWNFRCVLDWSASWCHHRIIAKLDYNRSITDRKWTQPKQIYVVHSNRWIYWTSIHWKCWTLHIYLTFPH